MLPIKAFGLKQGWQTDHYNYLIGGFGTCHSLSDQLLIGFGGFRIKTFGVYHLTGSTQCGGKHVQWLVD